MSSEMREFRKALQDCVMAMDVARDTIQPITTAQIRLHNLNPQTDKLLDDAAAKAIALLARTEAGADGAVGYVAADGGVIWLADGSYNLKPAAGTNLFIHPQDASGDAGRYRWLKSKLLEADFEPDDYVALTFALPAGSQVSANLDATLDAVMQAKEAK